MENLAEVIDDETLVEEALNNFAAILDGADYNTPLEIMGIGRLQFLMRRQMTRELAGLYAALWRLALGRSFPKDADRMFTEFLKRYAKTHRGKAGTIVIERATGYWQMLEPCGDTDFNEAARHLISFLIKTQQDTRALTLKLVLHLRIVYRLIFDHLI